MRINFNRYQDQTAVRIFIVCVAVIGQLALLPAGTQAQDDVLGVYFDTTGLTNTITAPAGTLVTGYLVLTNPTQEGPIIGWECRVSIDAGPFEASGNPTMGSNFLSGMDFFVPIGRVNPLPSGNMVVLATLQWLVLTTDHYNIYLHPCSIPSSPGNMIYVAGDDPGAFTPLNWSSGDEATPVAIINPQTTGSADIDPEPDILTAGWSVTGPYSYEASGSGDESLTGLIVGTYELTWDDIPLWNSPEPNPVTFVITVGENTVVQGVYDQNPRIIDCMDVGNDQGRHVRLIWLRTGHDALEDPIVVTEYGIYRRQDNYKADPADKLAGWDFLATVPAHGEEIYQYVAETLCDCIEGEDPCYSGFFVRGMTDDPYVFYDSPVVECCSIDNLSPDKVLGLSVAFAGDGNVLNWLENEEPDVQFYRVYRGETSKFELGEPVATVAGTSWTDDLDGIAGSAWDVCYLLTAVDFAGNEGEPTVWEETTVSGVNIPDTPNEFALHKSFPNPFNPRTTIRYDLPRTERVNIAIFDIQGRRVRTLVPGIVQKAGRYEEVWSGLDDRDRPLPAGIYIYRMETSTFTASERMVLLK